MPITALPPAPSRADPANFSDKADAWVGAMDLFTTEANALAADVNNKQTIASTAATTASTQAGIATTKANEANSSAIAADASADLAAEWATKVSNPVDGSEYSAKEYASGSTVASGSAKEWANQVGSTVNGSEYSAKEYATGATVPTGSSKEWANLIGSAVDGSEYSAKHYANEAAVLTEKYQGSLTTDPVLDKSGNPITSGDWYVNSTTGYIRVYNGSSWVQGLAAVAGVTSVNTQTGDLTLKTVNSQGLLGAGNILIDTNLYVSSRTSNAQLIASDKAKLIDITSGTFTQTFAACSSLGDGWYCYIKNSGSGDITLDPNSSETIDGLTTFVMYPGEVRLVQCNGTILRSVVLNSFYKKFIASGTFTKPPGYKSFQGLLWGGGGSGEAIGANTFGGGGGGGGCIPFTVAQSDLNSAETVTIGAGGLSVGSAQASGNSGGSSHLGGIVTITGGTGGTVTSPGTGGGWDALDGYGTTSIGTYSGGNAGDLNSGDSNGRSSYFGGGGGGGYNSGSTTAGKGGNSYYGGAGGGGRASSGTTTGAGGSSKFGGAGGAGNGGDGSIPGGGGGCSMQNGISGAGARGELRIWGII